jgi:hypothetical protein
MMWYFRLPGEEQQGDLPIGLKCALVLMDMWGNSVNLVPQDFGMNQQMGVPLHLVYLVTAMDMQISVTLRLVSLVQYPFSLFIFSQLMATMYEKWVISKLS